MAKIRNSNQMELLRLKYLYIERIVTLAIVALITLGGFACIICGQPIGQSIIIAVLGFFGGGLYAQRTARHELDHTSKNGPPIHDGIT